MPPTTQVAIRLDNDLLDAIDEVARLMSTSWRPVSRADVLRGCIEHGLPVLRRAAEAQSKALAEAIPDAPNAPNASNAPEGGAAKGRRKGK